MKNNNNAFCTFFKSVMPQPRLCGASADRTWQPWSRDNKMQFFKKLDQLPWLYNHLHFLEKSA